MFAASQLFNSSFPTQWAYDVRPFGKAKLRANLKKHVQRDLDKLGWSYIHTAAAGWIDTGHFSNHARISCTVVRLGGSEYQGVLESWKAGIRIEKYQEFQTKHPSLLTSPVREGSSAWSHEDLPSNMAGAEFGLWWIRGGLHKNVELWKGIKQYLTGLGAVMNSSEVEKLPGFKALPDSQEDYEKEWMSRSDRENAAEVDRRRAEYEEQGWLNERWVAQRRFMRPG
jgi:hypothetical protein